MTSHHPGLTEDFLERVNVLALKECMHRSSVLESRQGMPFQANRASFWNGVVKSK